MEITICCRVGDLCHKHLIIGNHDGKLLANEPIRNNEMHRKKVPKVKKKVNCEFIVLFWKELYNCIIN